MDSAEYHPAERCHGGWRQSEEAEEQHYYFFFSVPRWIENGMASGRSKTNENDDTQFVSQLFTISQQGPAAMSRGEDRLGRGSRKGIRIGHRKVQYWCIEATLKLPVCQSCVVCAGVSQSVSQSPLEVVLLHLHVILLCTTTLFFICFLKYSVSLFLFFKEERLNR